MQYTLERGEQPGVAPTYAFLAERTLQPVDELCRALAAAGRAPLREGRLEQRTVAADREEAPRAGGIGERTAGGLDLAHELSCLRIDDRDRLCRREVV